MKAGVSNYELQSAAGGGAGGSPVLCGLGFYIQIRAQPGSKVVISTLGLSLEALSLCTFISAESSLSMKHPFLSSQSHQNLQMINTFTKYGAWVQFSLCRLSRLPTVGDVVLWPHHPDIAPV